MKSTPRDDDEAVTLSQKALLAMTVKRIAAPHKMFLAMTRNYLELYMNEHSYKIAFVFAITLHAVLILFLLIKFTTSHSLVLNNANVFNNAVIVNAHLVGQQMKMDKIFKPISSKLKEEITTTVTSKPITKTQANIFKKPLNNKIKNALQKNLLMEQAEEMAELKKEKHVHQKNIAKRKQEQMLGSLQNEILAEQKQLASMQSEGYGDKTSGEIHFEKYSDQEQGEIGKYQAMVIQAISSQWTYPQGVDEGASCQLLINVAPGGEVLSTQLLKSSGNLILDRSAQAAVLKASPLPVPQKEELFNEFRVLKLKFNPKGLLIN